MHINSNFITRLNQLLGCSLPDIQVKGICIDSREVKPDFCFLALAGQKVHGSTFNDLAVAKGASLILVDTNEQELHAQQSLIDGKTVCLFVCGLNQLAGEIAALFYRPTDKTMALIGVTGTNGKTSVCEMIYQLAENLNQKAAYMGTLGVKYQAQLAQTGLTTPDAVKVQRYLAEFAEHDCQLAAMEVSSHAVVQHRIAGCQFNQVVFTNLSHDHLDYHQTMQAYFEAKASLFLQNPTALQVINTDSEYGQKLFNQLHAVVDSDKLFAVGLNAEHFSNNYLKLVTAEQLPNGFSLTVEVQLPATNSVLQQTFKLPLIAQFNVENALLAIACMLNQGFELAQVAKAAGLLKPVAGRMEVFTTAKNVNLIVDFAHTPDGLEKALTACKAHCSGDVWVVFGCGGDRDKQKRSKMGQIAALLADKIILTNDNPRTESPEAIVEQIIAGIQAKDYQVEFDRKNAIKLALANANSQDCILVAGKGHETYQEFANGKVNYNERLYVAELAAEVAA
ncbi:UDP-N-acetylmuramoyl-L-alanyl-D-glutamate--2,6-diaminopimelate ligase [Catenovulum sp. 2E275]|uniref:UDP-N-acetylmuramoyl-L-alanyl-D-glutamate--2, 6-diaminopimelate ligase n=1 Tax=Catenovulum sp. 2E275 TaxID=2980497 RepID=UPI0021D24DB3|nr:UDP-N-acetylmuramoyl-L-alanyl-D-glutamate--2,6-diaminopimelate ligase [Catenovulum sp. 2E275]MCU4674217.1 UDP-N-acetylmuramoyl-L-alanyl-D-glutamate--2,6-diaminopimelate ligase [Catenovulum sp. 2E275]